MPVKRTEPEEFEDQCAVPIKSGFSVIGRHEIEAGRDIELPCDMCHVLWMIPLSIKPMCGSKISQHEEKTHSVCGRPEGSQHFAERLRYEKVFLPVDSAEFGRRIEERLFVRRENALAGHAGCVT